MTDVSLDDLESAGVLLPREEWGKRSLKTTLSPLAVVACGAVAIVATASMYLGRGGVWTVLGAAVFLADLFAFTWLAIRAVDRQNEARE